MCSSYIILDIFLAQPRRYSFFVSLSLASSLWKTRTKKNNGKRRIVTQSRITAGTHYHYSLWQHFQVSAAFLDSCFISILLIIAVFNRFLWLSDMKYLLETSVYPREPQILKELRAVTATHPLWVLAKFYFYFYTSI